MDGTLRHTQAGAGRPLLLVHGAMVAGAMFDGLVPLLRDRYRLLVPDLRGHGASGHLPPADTVERHAADLARLVDDLDLDRLGVLGYSHGGAVAQHLARDRPDRVERLVLVCTFACNRITAREKLESWALPWVLPLVGPERVADALASASAGLTADQAATLRALVAGTDRDHAFATLRAIRAFDSRPWLDRIRCPTLVVAGSSDVAVPLHHAEMLHRGILGSELRVVEGAGHTLAWTHPAELAALVDDWWTDGTGAGTT